MAQFNYQKYFEQITPKTKMEVYNRFLFAFLSVHTNWQSNVRAYNLMKNQYHTDEKETLMLLVKSKVGMYNHRTKYIIEFI